MLDASFRKLRRAARLQACWCWCQHQHQLLQATLRISESRIDPMLARIAIYAWLCVAGTHARISVHGRDDIVTTDGLLAFSRNLSLAMFRRTGMRQRDKYLAMLRQHGYPSAAEKELGAELHGR